MLRGSISVGVSALSIVVALAFALPKTFCQSPLALRPLPQGLLQALRDSGMNVPQHNHVPYVLANGSIVAPRVIPSPSSPLWELVEATTNVVAPKNSKEAWARAIEGAKSQYILPDQGRLKSRGESLHKYLTTCETYFKQLGILADVEAELPWRAALYGLKNAPTDEETLQSLEEVAIGAIGLDDNPFPWITLQTNRYLNLAYLLQEESPQAVVEAELEVLPELWDRSQQIDAVTAQADFAQTLLWLDHVGFDTNFAQPFTDARRWSNGYAAASRNLVTRGWNTAVNNRQPVSEFILGTRVRGVGDTNGSFALTLLPDPGSAKLLAQFQGVNRSNTRGVNGPAIIYSRANTTLSAPIYASFDGRQLSASLGQATAKAKSTTTGIGSTKQGLIGRIVRRVARRRSAEMRAEGDRIAGGRAAQRLAASMNEQLAQGVNSANARIRERIAALERTGRFPTLWRVRSSRDALHFNFGFAAPGQLGASAPPDVDLQGDFVVFTHQSLVNNYADTLLAGRDFSPEKLRAAIETRNPELAKRLPAPSTDAKFELTFATTAPVAAAFHDDVIDVFVRTRQLGTEEQSTEDLDIHLRLAPIHKAGKVVLVRQVLEVQPSRFAEGDDARLSVREIGEKSKLEDRLSKVIPLEFPLETIIPPSELRTSKLLSPQRVIARNGWLGLSYAEGYVIASR